MKYELILYLECSILSNHSCSHKVIKQPSFTKANTVSIFKSIPLISILCMVFMFGCFAVPYISPPIRSEFKVSGAFTSDPESSTGSTGTSSPQTVMHPYYGFTFMATPMQMFTKGYESGHDFGIGLVYNQIGSSYSSDYIRRWGGPALDYSYAFKQGELGIGRLGLLGRLALFPSAWNPDIGFSADVRVMADLIGWLSAVGFVGITDHVVNLGVAYGGAGVGVSLGLGVDYIRETYFNIRMDVGFTLRLPAAVGVLLIFD